MISDAERREVARRLRELPDDSTYPDLIGAIADHDGWYAAADAADRLADLIEPAQDHFIDPGEKVDRDALLELAEVMQAHADGAASADSYPYVNAGELWSYADRIREACGEVVG